MCISKETMNAKIQEIRSLKALKEETENAIKALEYEVIEFLQQTEECKTTNKKGDAILQFIGCDYKATYSQHSRETVDKSKVKALLSAEKYSEVVKRSTYNVLAIK